MRSVTEQAVSMMLDSVTEEQRAATVKQGHELLLLFDTNEVLPKDNEVLARIMLAHLDTLRLSINGDVPSRVQHSLDLLVTCAYNMGKRRGTGDALLRAAKQLRERGKQFVDSNLDDLVPQLMERPQHPESPSDESHV